jgi:hypothetical protein
MKITEKIVDLTTGNETISERTETENEKIQREEGKTKQAEQQAKALARQAVLDKLGLTAEEMAALLA